MALSRRAIMLEELAKLRVEGAIDQATFDALTARYQAEPDVALAPDATAAAPSEPRAAFTSNALQIAGGLLLGAAAVALVFFLGLKAPADALALLGFATLAALGGYAAQRAGRSAGLAEAAYSAALVAAGVASVLARNGTASNPAGDPWIAYLAAILAALVVFVARSGPVLAAGAVAFALASGNAFGFENVFDDRASLGPWLWQAALIAFGAMLIWRARGGWSSVALALLVLPLAIDALSLIRQSGVTASKGMELALGLHLLAVLGAGILLRDRGIVVGAAAGLTIDAVVFAFDLGGAGTAVIVLLLLGGLLVWQAEVVRGYLRRRSG